MTRAGDGRSGFFVADNVSFPATALFDIQDTLVPSAMTDSLVITGPGTNGGVPLLVSAELAGVLGDSGLAGAPVGEARVDAMSAVPEASPGLFLTAATLFGLASYRRRRQR